MDTQSLNWLDTFIARLRVRQVLPFVDADVEVLDIGCGLQGYLLHRIAPVIHHGTGIDYDIHDYQEGNLTFKRVRLRQSLPLPSQSIDIIFLLAVLEHLDPNHCPALFRDMRRVLRPQGKVVLTVPTTRAKRILEFLAFKLGVINKLEIADHNKYYDQGDLEQIAKKTGFTITHYALFEWGCNSICVLHSI